MSIESDTRLKWEAWQSDCRHELYSTIHFAAWVCRAHNEEATGPHIDRRKKQSLEDLKRIIELEIEKYV